MTWHEVVFTICGLAVGVPIGVLIAEGYAYRKEFLDRRVNQDEPRTDRI